MVTVRVPSTSLLHLLWVLIWCTVTCHAAIRFLLEPQSTAVLDGHDLTLDCIAEDTPEHRPVSYQWEYESRPIYESLPRANVFTNNSIYVTNFHTSDEGNFVCVAQVTGNPATALKSRIASVKVAYIRSFHSSPGSVIIDEGYKLTLECITGLSAPPAVVHWEKNGQLFTGGTQLQGTYGNIGNGGESRISMKLELDVKPETGGEYQCVAQNSLTQEVKTSVKAEVQVSRVPAPPSITESATNTLAPLGLPLMLPCDATGWPTPNVTWMRDGEILNTNTSTLQAMTNNSLYLPSVALTDGGAYVCSVSNSLGSDTSSPAVVTVTYLMLNFSEEPGDMEVIAGQSIVLPCIPPSSNPPAHIVWYKDNSQLQMSSGEFGLKIISDGLLFENVQLSDAGEYYCVAVNDHALPSTRNSAPAQLYVQAVPILTEPPMPARVVKGELLTLVCRVLGNPEPVVSWYKDDTLLTASSEVLFSNSNQQLILGNVNKLDEGDYKCHAANSLGSVTSQPVFVFVIVPPEITTSVPNLFVPLESSTVLACVVYADPTATIQWFKDGVQVVETSRVHAVADGLQISEVRESDAGSYQCVATNEGGSKQSEGSLTIQSAPVLYGVPDNVTVTASHRVILQCAATGNPPPSYIWTFNGSSSLPEGATLSDGGGIVVITSAEPHQTGTYTCTATNLVGSDSRAGSVFVQVMPVIEEIVGDLTVNAGTDLQLTCKVTGTPAPAVSWYHGGFLLQPTPNTRISFPTSNSLIIKFVTSADGGNYRCQATNDAGEMDMAVTVAIKDTPLAPLLVFVSPVSTSSINVTWQPPLDNPYRPVTHYVIEYKERLSSTFQIFRDDIPASLTTYEVDQLEPYTEYFVRVAAKNEIGVGVYSSVLSARTLETAPSEPRNLFVEAHNSTAVQLQWEIPAETNGQIRTYQLQYRKKFANDEFIVLEVAPPTFPLQRYTLSNLEPYMTYEFRVRGATIENGVTLWGEFSNLLDVTTSAAVPAPPDNVICIALETSQIHVSWQALAEEYHNGPLRGYKVKYRRTATSGPFLVAVVNTTTTQVILSQLQPWQYYTLYVVAFNTVGESSPSETQNIRTAPQAPSGSPINLQAKALASDIIHVSWQPVAIDQRNSELSGYLIEYKVTGESDALSRYIGNADILAYNITYPLEPFTSYTIRIQAFTTQVKNGYGPFSDIVTVVTDQATPGAVQNLTATPILYGLHLTWMPPLQMNGIVDKYIISYTSSLAGSTQSTNSDIISGTIVQQNIVSNATTVETVYTNITLADLQPAFVYKISVVARNQAGVSPTPVFISSVITMVTTMTPQVTLAPMTPEPVSETVVTGTQGNNPPALQTRTPDDLTSDNLPFIIGAAVAGGVALILIIILIVVLCCRRQKKKTGMYYDHHGKAIPPVAEFKRGSVAAQSTSSSNIEMRHSDRSGTNTKSTNETNVGDGTDMANSSMYDSTAVSSIGNGQPPRTYPKLTVERTHADQDTRQLGAVGGQNLDSSSQNELHLAHVQEDWLTNILRTPMGGAYEGPGVLDDDLFYDDDSLDNPAYDPDASIPTTQTHIQYTSSPSYPQTPFSSTQDLYNSINASKRRRNRMKNNTAAAIAAQRNRDTSVFADTDILIDNTESVIVYNERTAL